MKAGLRKIKNFFFRCNTDDTDDTDVTDVTEVVYDLPSPVPPPLVPPPRGTPKKRLSPVYSYIDPSISPLSPVYSPMDPSIPPVPPKKRLGVTSSNDTFISPISPVYSSNDTFISPISPVYSSNDTFISPISPVYSSNDTSIPPVPPKKRLGVTSSNDTSIPPLSFDKGTELNERVKVAELKLKAKMAELEAEIAKEKVKKAELEKEMQYIEHKVASFKEVSFKEVSFKADSFKEDSFKEVLFKEVLKESISKLRGTKVWYLYKIVGSIGGENWFFWGVCALFCISAVVFAVMVIAAVGPVYGLLCLILVFLSVSVIFFLLNLGFVGFIMIIVYVGAIAILFLFVMMMLDQDKEGEGRPIANFIPIGLVVGGTFLWMGFSEVVWAGNLLSQNHYWGMIGVPPGGDIEMIGRVLYTDYSYMFIIVSYILLVAMVGAIVLTHRHDKYWTNGPLRQDIYIQTNRKIWDRPNNQS